MSQTVDPAGLRPLGIGEVLDVAIKLYRAHFVTLVKIVAVVTAPVTILSAIIQESATPEDLESTGSTFDPSNEFGREPEIDGGDVMTFLAAILVTLILTGVATQLASGACFKVLSGAYVDERSDWRASLRFAVGRLRSLVWLTVIHGVIVFVGILACIAPGVYLYAAWAVAVPVLLLEDRRGFKALNRSRELVTGRWGPVALVLLLMSVLSGVVAFGLTALLELPVLATDSDLVILIFSTIGSVIAGMLTTPFGAAAVVVLYVDLRVRKEGFDLQLLARRIGVEPPTGPVPSSLAGGQFLPPPPPPGAPGVPGLPGPAGPGGTDDRPPYWPPPPGWRPRSGGPDA